TVVGPGVIAAVLVNSETMVSDWSHGKVRHDNRNVPRARDHGIGTVGSALARCTAMRMHIGDNLETAFTAPRPQLRETVAVKDTNAGAVCVGIEIVVKDDLRNFRAPFEFLAEQKGAGFVASCAAAVEFGKRPAP
ncbi:MAG: hypothetical protein WAV72_27300, partial [Bradyrhizobium sp.]